MSACPWAAVFATRDERGSVGTFVCGLWASDFGPRCGGGEVPARDFGQDLNATLAVIDDNTRIVFIANPNNPTGTWVKRRS